MARGTVKVRSINGALTVTFTTASGHTPTIYSDSALTTTQALPATVADGATGTFYFASPGAHAMSVKTASGLQIADDLNTTRAINVDHGQTSSYSYDARLVGKDASGDSGRHPHGSNFVPWVPASGDTTGATDVAAINAMQRCVLVPNQTYYLNAPIVRPSASYLGAVGATIHQVTAGQVLIRNTKAVATRTVTDGVGNNGSATLTSATANFVSGDIGSKVGVVGAATGGATWYGTITAVGSTTSCTVSVTADVNVTGATVYIYAGRDSDITVEGGTWVMDNSPPDGHTATSTYLNSFASAFRRVDGLRIRDTRWTMPGAGGAGGKFSVSLADVDDFIVDGTHFTGTAGDGVHVMGPASNGEITNTSGTTGDDMVVISPGDANTPYITDTEGNLSNIVTRGITPNGSLRAFKIYDLALAKKFTISGCHAHDINGSTLNQAVAILTANADEIRLSNITANVTNAGVAAVLLSNVNYTTKITIDGVCWKSANAATTGIVQVDQGRNVVQVKNVSMATAPAGVNIGVLVGGVTNGTNFGLTRLDVDGVYLPLQVGGTPVTFATFHAIDIEGSGSGSGDSTLTVRGVSGKPTAGYVVKKGTACPFSVVQVSDCDWSGTGLFKSTTSDPKTNLQVDNVRITGTNLADCSSSADVYVSNVMLVTSGAAVVANGGATGINLLAGPVKQTGAGAAPTAYATTVIA